MTKEINWLEILLWIILIAIFIMILTRIFGKSATDVQLYLGFFSGLLVVMGYLAKLNREFGEFKIEVRNALEQIREGINNLKK